MIRDRYERLHTRKEKSLRDFFCANGFKLSEKIWRGNIRRRKSSLHCAKRNFTQKAQPSLHIFTQPRRRLTCEVVSFRYRSIPLVKRSACAAREVFSLREQGWCS